MNEKEFRELKKAEFLRNLLKSITDTAHYWGDGKYLTSVDDVKTEYTKEEIEFLFETKEKLENKLNRFAKKFDIKFEA